MVETPIGVSLFMFAAFLAVGLVGALNWKRADKKARAVVARISPGNDSPWYYKAGIVTRLATVLIALSTAGFFLIRVIRSAFS